MKTNPVRRSAVPLVFACVLALIGTLCSVGTASAVGNILDASYATGSTYGSGVTAYLSGFGDKLNAGRGVAIQYGDKIVVAGTFNNNGLTDTSGLVLRYTMNGILDETFNGTGSYEFSGGGTDKINAVKIDSKDRIVLVGTYDNSAAGTRTDIWVLRLNPDGTLDETFGPLNTGEIVFTNAGDDSGNAVAIDSNDKIIVVGTVGTGAGKSSAQIIRLNDEGSLDTTFNQTGSIMIAGSSDPEGIHTANAVGLDSADNIVVTGSTSLGNGNSAMWVLRLASEGTAAGTLDATFGTDGEVALGDNGAHSGNAVAIDANGKIVLVGTYDWSNDTSNAAQKTDIWVQRLNSDGSVDPDFYGNNNIGGASYGGTGFDTGNAVVIQPDDGKIIVVGTYDSGGGNTAAWVQRLDDEGQPSTTFNNGSSIYMSAGIGQFSGNAVVLQDDKKIVVAGSGNITIDGEDTSTVMSLRLHGSSYQLAITSIGSGSVTVAQGQGTLVYDGNIGTENYFPALSPQVVTLTAEPLTGWVFTGWSGDVDCPTTGSCDVTMDSSKNVTATFEMPQLTVITSGAGTGTVTSAPGGITCANGMGTNGCSNTFSSNSEVTLTASLIAWYSVFTGWSGDCVANGLSCVVTMDQLTKTVNAVFADNNNVRLNGAGFYSTLNNAYLAGYAAGIPATIDAQVFSFQENLQLDRAITVSLNGGLGSGFSANAGTSYSTIKGSLKVSAGRLNAKYIKVQ